MKTTALRNDSHQNGSLMPTNGAQPDWESFLAGISDGKTILEVSANRNIFRQGEQANAAYYLRQGSVKLAVTSEEGKEAIVGLVAAGELFGESCLGGQMVRPTTAIALTDCTLIRLEKSVLTSLLHQHCAFSELLIMNVLLRNIRYEEDLVDQLFNTSEQRLARNLLRLARFHKKSVKEPVVPKVNQETLAQMVGTTRSRVSHFMNKFRQNGFVDYNSRGDLLVHQKLLTVVNGWPAYSQTGQS